MRIRALMVLSINQRERNMNTAESFINELQTINSDTLSKAARGEIDLNIIAKEILANRGQDEFGNWVGFKK
jgi:hypothetical protein